LAQKLEKLVSWVVYGCFVEEMKLVQNVDDVNGVVGLDVAFHNCGVFIVEVFDFRLKMLID
jgi:hypothetical protein